MKSSLLITTLIATHTLTLICHATEIAQKQQISKQSATYDLLDTQGKTTASNARCASFFTSGLTWELKTDDGGIHDKDNKYRWGGAGAEQTGTLFFDDWNALLVNSNSKKLCGFDDWRVPSIDELKTLIMNTDKKPVIDSVIFPLTLGEPYWSVSTYQYYPEHAQTVDFSTGSSHYYNGFRGDRLSVRLVRGNMLGDNQK